jgi:hypothetical protein
MFMRFGLVLKNQSEIQSSGFKKKRHPNTSKKIRFFVVFCFFLSVCGFNLDWIEFEHPYVSASLTFLSKIIIVVSS